MNVIRRHPFVSFLVGLGVFVFAVTVAVGAANSNKSLNLVPQSGSSDVSTVSATPAVTHSAKKTHHTIEYVVTGAPAEISFGVMGAEQGDVPMHVTRTFHPKVDDTYEIIAYQASAGYTGSTYIKILVDGKVMAHATANSEHKTATVDITRMLGEWTGTGWAA